MQVKGIIAKIRFWPDLISEAFYDVSFRNFHSCTKTLPVILSSDKLSLKLCSLTTREQVPVFWGVKRFVCIFNTILY